MKNHYQAIYHFHAPEYDRMVSAEDGDGALAPALGPLADWSAAQVCDVGAGTGRLTRIAASLGARSVWATDAAAAMLQVAEQRWPPGLGGGVKVADARALPFADDSADIGMAGWVFGHWVSWESERWEHAIDAGVSELSRVVRPGGALLVLETLGTGALAPAPPTKALAAYYRRLENNHGFARREIATDYVFDSVEEAESCCGFFFGESLAQAIRENGWARVPEYTGIWSRTK